MKNVSTKNDHCILMADIVDSRHRDQKQLMIDFKQVTQSINQKFAKKFLSPLTITLGDEFQGVAKNASSAIQAMFSIEENLIQSHSGFKLRYVLIEGEIDTPINKEIAYGMLGEGLTRARAALQESKATQNRFYFELRNTLTSQALNNSFLIYQSLVDNWKIDNDYDLVSEFLKTNDYKTVAQGLGKTRSQIWKREKSLKIKEYTAIKEVIKYISL